MAELRDTPTADIFTELLERCKGDTIMAGAVDMAFDIYKERQRDRQTVETAGGKEYGAMFKNVWFKCIYGESGDEQRERFDKYLPRAINRGYMAVTDNGEIVWETANKYGGKTELALFVFYLYGNGAGIIPYKDFQRIFGVKNLYNLLVGALDRLENPRRFFSTVRTATGLKRAIFYD